MKFFPLFAFIFVSFSSFAQAPSCSTQTVVGTCVNGFLVDGRHYVYDSAGNVVQIRLYLGGEFVGTALVNDSVAAPTPKPIIRIPNASTVTFAPDIKYTVDSVKQTVDCSSFQYPPDTGVIGSLPITDGNDTWVISANGRIKRNGYFIDGRLQCGVEYLYDKKGRLVTMNVYREGKITRTVKVPKAKKKKR